MSLMQVWGLTDKGLVRKENQDAYVAADLSGHTVCVVCDGMGGTAGGKLASSIATKAYMAEIAKVLSPEMTPEQLREASAYAVALTNQAVREAAQNSESTREMGTTLVAAIGCATGAVISNVGDSRAYHICKNGITQVTKDHSWVGQMVDNGRLTAEQARNNPNRKYITRALGPDITVECDGFICSMEPGDYLLLCTDGLVNTVTDEELLVEIIHGDGPDTCLNRLLEISKSRGASDNVTAVLMLKS